MHVDDFLLYSIIETPEDCEQLQLDLYKLESYKLYKSLIYKLNYYTSS